MLTLIKIIGGFWIIWFIWYFTGGPLRDNRSKPYVGFTASGTIEYFEANPKNN